MKYSGYQTLRFTKQKDCLYLLPKMRTDPKKKNLKLQWKKFWLKMFRKNASVISSHVLYKAPCDETPDFVR